MGVRARHGRASAASMYSIGRTPRATATAVATIFRICSRDDKKTRSLEISRLLGVTEMRAPELAERAWRPESLPDAHAPGAA